MPQLTVRKIEEKLARAEHRCILRASSLRQSNKRTSYKKYLRRMPNLGPDEMFERPHDLGRKVKL